MATQRDGPRPRVNRARSGAWTFLPDPIKYPRFVGFIVDPEYARLDARAVEDPTAAVSGGRPGETFLVFVAIVGLLLGVRSVAQPSTRLALFTVYQLLEEHAMPSA